MKARSRWSDEYELDVMNRFGLVAARESMNGVVYEGDYRPNPRGGGLMIAASYYYHIDHRIAIGGFFGYRGDFKDTLGYPEVYAENTSYPTGFKPVEIQKTGFTDVKGSTLFFMPSVKWSYMNCRWCSLYMKATLGFRYQSLHLDSEAIPDKQTDKYKKHHFGFASYVTPIGWEIGRRNIRWFMEFGIGTNSNFQTGLTYRFGKY